VSADLRGGMNDMTDDVCEWGSREQEKSITQHPLRDAHTMRAAILDGKLGVGKYTHTVYHV